LYGSGSQSVSAVPVFHVLFNTRAKPGLQVTNSYSKSVYTDSQFFCHCLAVLDPLLAFTIMIAHDQCGLFGCEKFFETFLETLAAKFELPVIRSRRRRRCSPLERLQPLLINPLRHAVKIKRGIALVSLYQPIDLRRYDVKGFIGKIFGGVTTPGGENFYDAGMDTVVFLRRFLAVGIQPGKQLLQSFLTWWLSLAHLMRQVSRRSVGVVTDNDMDGVD